jgi:hypothetical protein
LRFLTLVSGAPALFGGAQEPRSRQGSQQPHDIQHENDEAKALMTTFGESVHAVEDIKMAATPKLQQIRDWVPESSHRRRLHAVRAAE